MKELEEANNKFIQKRNLWEARRDWEDLTQKWYEDDFVTLDA